MQRDELSNAGGTPGVCMRGRGGGKIYGTWKAGFPAYVIIRSVH